MFFRKRKAIETKTALEIYRYAQEHTVKETLIHIRRNFPGIRGRVK